MIQKGNKYMGTVSFIGRKNLDNTITGVYCHWDGDISWNGIVLNKCYKNIDKINELINLGSLSSLDAEIGEETDFNNPAENQCVAYHRDRGEDLEIQQYKNEKEVINQYYEYVYIYDMHDSKWYCCDKTGRKLLSDIIKEWTKTNKHNIKERSKSLNEYIKSKKETV